MRLLRAIGAAATLVVLLVGLPAVLVVAVGSPWPEGGWTSVSLMTDAAILGLLGVIGWIAWAQFALCLMAEVIGEVRRVPAPSFGPRIQREMARGLVRAVLMIGATGTIAATSWHALPTESASAADLPVASPASLEVVPVSNAAQTSAPVHVVEAGDTLWGIAETHLGDGLEWRSIADLNRGRTMTDGSVFRAADEIRPGWRLELPAAGQGRATSFTVQSGDTLSSIAEAEFGDAAQWRTLYRENRATIGDDPDLIDIGQRLVVPASTPDVEPTPSTVESLPNRTSTPPADSTPSSGPHVVDGPPVRPPAELSDGASPSSDDEVPVTAVTPWRAVLATGSCLAVGLLGLVVASRRRQLAARRPGRLVRASPPELRPLERAIHEVGHDRLDDVTFIDLGLRSLSLRLHELHQPLPNLGAAILSTHGLKLKLVGLPDDVPPLPWESVDDETWLLPRASELTQDAAEHPAPYPALVSTGTDDSGALWLLDLEAHGGAGLSIPPGLLRHWVTELASNPWGTAVELLVAAPEFASLATLNPERATVIDPDLASRRAHALEDDASARFASLLELRRDGAVEDATGPVVIIGAVQKRDGGARQRDRVVLLADGCRELLAQRDGTWSIADWDVQIEPFLLDARALEHVAALLGDTEDLSDDSDPRAGSDADQPRDGEAWEPGSLLPAPDRAYLASYDDITRDDLARLAPGTQLAETLSLDPDLDADVADWNNANCLRPKVKVLGPVDVTALHGSRDGIRNTGGTVEFIVYLALAEHGVTKDRAAEALGWSGATVQNRARDARRLMGLRPDGGDWLPDAARSEGARSRGVPTYELHNDVLVDADLVTRLRARARAAGADGHVDVSTALRLVDGDPFDQLRKGGYGWLLEGDRLDLHFEAMIEDLRLLRDLRQSA